MTNKQLLNRFSEIQAILALPGVFARTKEEKEKLEEKAFVEAQKLFLRTVRRYTRFVVKLSLSEEATRNDYNVDEMIGYNQCRREILIKAEEILKESE